MGRVIPGLAMAGLWLLLLLQGSFLLFFSVLLLASLIGSIEYVQMTLPGSSSREKYLLTAVILLPTLFTAFLQGPPSGSGLFLSFFLLSLYVLYSYKEAEKSFSLLGRTSFAIIYIGFFTAHLVSLFLLPHGNSWIIILTAVTAGSDSGAYYSGRFFGRHKLCPLISPNKTVEGAVGGILAGVLIAAIMAFFVLPDVNMLLLVPIAVCLGGVGICGDLSESIIKRATATKDSGSILAGHGGILDRMDSLLFASPVLYYILLLAGGS